MNKIKLNNLELEVESYNKNTYFSGDSMNSNASMSVRIDEDDITDLNALAASPITTIQIHADERLIYDLQNINAKIDSINEYLNGDRMNVSVNLTFNA